jgi:hypothetical protein
LGHAVGGSTAIGPIICMIGACADATTVAVGPLLGGTAVQVSGLDLQHGTEHLCLFGSIRINASFDATTGVHRAFRSSLAIPSRPALSRPVPPRPVPPRPPRPVLSCTLLPGPSLRILLSPPLSACFSCMPPLPPQPDPQLDPSALLIEHPLHKSAATPWSSSPGSLFQRRVLGE